MVVISEIRVFQMPGWNFIMYYTYVQNNISEEKFSFKHSLQKKNILKHSVVDLNELFYFEIYSIFPTPIPNRNSINLSKHFYSFGTFSSA